MSIITIILFFLYTWGLGFTAASFFKESRNFLEMTIMRSGIGLGIFPILSIILNFFHVPLDWRIFLLISMAFPLWKAVLSVKTKKIVLPKIKLTKSNISLAIVLVLFIFTLFMYTKGAFAYPYLEDEDCWGHSVGVKYVALEKNAYDPELKNTGVEIDPVLSYIDPYPPAYDVLMGVLHQTSSSMRWTLKFFNALIISLGIFFFYFFAKQFIGDRNKAVFSTFVLAMIPCYLSHFIWAHALAVTLFFPMMYCFERIRIDKKWMIPSAIIFGSVWVSQNMSQPIKLTIMVAIYLVVDSIVRKKFQKEAFIAAVSGILLSLFWWGAMIAKYGLDGILDYYGTGSSRLASQAAAAEGQNFIISLILRVVRPGGSGTRSYLFRDFFIAKPDNMINNPIGIGIMITILVLISMIFILLHYKTSVVKKENCWIAVTLFWLIFTFWGVNGMTFNVSVAPSAFRVWMLLAIPAALVVSEGAWFLMDFFRKIKIPQLIILLILALLIFSTSGYQKYKVNTSTWPTSGSFSGGPQEAAEYAKWFDTLSPNTNVFLYSPRDKLAIGFDAYSCAWCQDVVDFRNDILNKNAEELHSFLKRNRYEYLVIGSMDSKYIPNQFGEEKSNELLPKRYEEIQTSGLFSPVYNSEGVMAAFRVV